MGPDQTLITECINGDRKAQAELYRMLYSELMSICRRYMHNDIDARSVLNQSFFKILKNLHAKKEGVPFKPWCRRITINTVISDHRKRSSDPEMVSLNPQDGTGSTSGHNAIDHAIEAERLQAMLDKLPDATRKVFNLFAIDGFAHKEIADMMEISINTSKWHVSDARKKLQAMLYQSDLNTKQLVES